MGNPLLFFWAESLFFSPFFSLPAGPTRNVSPPPSFPSLLSADAAQLALLLPPLALAHSFSLSFWPAQQPRPSWPAPYPLFASAQQATHGPARLRSRAAHQAQQPAPQPNPSEQGARTPAPSRPSPPGERPRRLCLRGTDADERRVSSPRHGRPGAAVALYALATRAYKSHGRRRSLLHSQPPPLRQASPPCRPRQVEQPRHRRARRVTAVAAGNAPAPTPRHRGSCRGHSATPATTPSPPRRDAHRPRRAPTPPPLHRELLVHSPCCHDDARGQQQATPVSRTSPGVADPFFAEHLTAKAELCPPRRWPTWTAVTPSEPSPGDLDTATPTPCRPHPAPHLATTPSAPSRGTRTSSRDAEQQQGSDTDLAPTTRVAQPPRQQRGGRDVVTLSVRRWTR
ncbi:serine/arginine repetitive matrix protein 1-like [Sorghum bicolor]|uniref:serine/arginine repetitive matrix protein 1-like n=1 Tax=Sorghum bicolor TaxID=4558 RepID=UPI000B423909|nr:serine/arginine repetitive matrix protein 1-like [Sorghum bicolor]|eukprot:XP_021321321.1 serine/arginine repetitive matrix protein 1-like [Sorghum bicolor]